jgi:hypothetical protein
MSDLIYPVVDKLDDVKTIDSQSYRVVATVATTIYWREFIKRILPENSRGIVVVFENPCCPSFTYQIK